MNFNVETNNYNKFDNKILQEKYSELVNMYLNEMYQSKKVAFYYENINDGTILSFNRNICFYAASSIKILACLMILEQAEQNIISLDDKILITMNDLKQDTGIIKYQKQDTYYPLKELIELTITESDNTAYLKLVDILGKENIAAYGKSLGATHTMEGKETDSFGIINCSDMIIYWKKVKEYLDSNQKYSKEFKDYLLNPSVKFIQDKNLESKDFVRKYGSWDIAYHEAGFIDSKNPYYLIILTQLNKLDYKEDFINDTANKILEIHKILTKKESD